MDELLHLYDNAMICQNQDVPCICQVIVRVLYFPLSEQPFINHASMDSFSYWATIHFTFHWILFDLLNV